MPGCTMARRTHACPASPTTDRTPLMGILAAIALGYLCGEAGMLLLVDLGCGCWALLGPVKTGKAMARAAATATAATARDRRRVVTERDRRAWNSRHAAAVSITGRVPDGGRSAWRMLRSRRSRSVSVMSRSSLVCGSDRRERCRLVLAGQRLPGEPRRWAGRPYPHHPHRYFPRHFSRRH